MYLGSTEVPLKEITIKFHSQTSAEILMNGEKLNENFKSFGISLTAGDLPTISISYDPVIPNEN